MPDADEPDEEPGVAPAIPPEPFAPAGFWRRFLAWAADMLILALLGYVVGLLFYNAVIQIGPYGRFFGLAVILIYFGLLNSGVGGGQTAGKGLLGIRVMGCDGRPVTLATSLVRAALLAGPYIFNGWGLPVFLRAPFAGWVQGVIVVGFGGSILYTMVFNRRTRQGLHDMLCRTYVEKVSAPLGLPIPPVPRVHLIVPGLFLALSLVSPLAGFAFRNLNPFGIDLTPILQLHATLSEDPRFFSIGINHNVMLAANPPRQVLTVQAWYVGTPTIEERQTAIDSLARIAVSEYAKIDDVTHVAIVIATAFDLGIASWTIRFMDVRPTGEWRRRGLTDHAHLASLRSFSGQASGVGWPEGSSIDMCGERAGAPSLSGRTGPLHAA